MFCGKCGAEINESTRFCPVCGTQVKNVSETETEIKMETKTVIEPEVKTEEKSEAMLENQPTSERKKKKGRKVILLLLGICILAVAILIAVPLISDQKKEKQFASNIEAGNTYLEELDYEKAEDSFLQAIQIKPKEKESYVKLSELYIANDEIEKAQDIVVKAIENVSKEDRKEFQEKQKEWKNLENYTWVVNPETEADDIYYLRGTDFFAHSYNEMKKQLYNEYAVIRQGTTYGLIGMTGNWYKDLKCSEVKTILDYYRIKTQNPIYSEEFEMDMNDYYIDKNGQLLEAVAVFGDDYGSQGTYYYMNGLYNTLDTQAEGMYGTRTWPLKELTTAIPVGQAYEKYTGQEKNQDGFWLRCEQWLDINEAKYAIWNNGELVTDFIYDECGSVGSGLLAVEKDGKWGYVDENGNEIIKTEYDASWQQYTLDDNTVKEFCYAASCGYVPLVKEGVWELRNTKGDLVVAPGVFEAIRPAYEGKCWVKKNGKWGVIALQNTTEEVSNEEDNDNASAEEEKPDTVTTEMYQDLYGKILDDIYTNTENDFPDHLNYCIYDIDKDGVKELLAKDGTCEQNYVYKIYTIKGGNSVYIDEISGFHTGFYADENGGTENYIIQVQGLNMYETRIYVYLENGQITTETVFDGNLGDDGKYYSNPYPIEYADILDRSLLKE